MNNVEYIVKNAKKAESILRKIAYPYYRKSFVDIDDIEFKAVFEPGDNFLGLCGDGEITINTAYFSCWGKVYCDKKLVEVLMHELLHHYIKEWFYERNTLKGFHADESPVFILFVMWFNAHLKDYRIGLNSELAHHGVMNIYKDIYSNLDTYCITDLYARCLDITRKMDDLITVLNCELHEKDVNLFIKCGFNYKLEDDCVGAYIQDEDLIIGIIGLNYFNDLDSLREDLEAMVDALLYQVEGRIVFDKENTTYGLWFKPLQ